MNKRPPELKIIEGGKLTPHVCHNERGGRRCDICFGPIPRVAPRPFDMGAAIALIAFVSIVVSIVAGLVVSAHP